MKWLRCRRRPEPEPELEAREPVDWDIKITVPEGTVLNVDTGHIWYSWKYGERSNDGYLDLMGGYRGGIHVWIKPAGWNEPDDRLAQLDGTGALPDGMRKQRLCASSC